MVRGDRETPFHKALVRGAAAGRQEGFVEAPTAPGLGIRGWLTRWPPPMPMPCDRAAPGDGMEAPCDWKTGKAFAGGGRGLDA